MDLNIIAPINHLSYGIVSTKIIENLTRLGINVALWPIGQLDQQQPDFIIKALNRSQFPNFDAPCLRIFHQFKLDWFVGRGPKIGFPIFELDQFTDFELDNLKNCNLVFVCSHWAQNILKRYEIDSYVIPLGTDDLLRPGKSESTYRFLSIGKWEIRKGHDILCDIFNNTFTKEDDVELICSHHNHCITKEQNQEWVSLYHRSILKDKIKFVPPLHRDPFIDLINSADCFVSLSRAEGWNLPLLEAMSCGKPCIAFNHSGQTEFCNENNCNLINVSEVEPAYDGVFFNSDGIINTGNWAKIGTEEKSEVSRIMRRCFDNRENSNLGGMMTATKFNWLNTANKIAEIITNA